MGASIKEKMMTQNSELKWRNAALKHLISDLWAKGTKNQSCAGEVDPNITRHIVTWGAAK